MVARDAGWLGRRRIELVTCASTNDEALRLARQGAEHGMVVVADMQTAGRGRLGRSWASMPGNLLMSVVLRWPAHTPLITMAAVPLAAGVAVARMLRAVGVPAGLKWPNDVGIVDDTGWRKLGGILAESVGGAQPAIVVGIGVNLVDAIPPELATVATSVQAQAGRALDRDAALARLCGELEAWIDAFMVDGVAAIKAPWQALMAPLPTLRTMVAGAPLDGTPLGLADDGALLLRDAAGVVHRVMAGEVVPMAAPLEGPT